MEGLQNLVSGVGEEVFYFDIIVKHAACFEAYTGTQDKQ